MACVFLTLRESSHFLETRKLLRIMKPVVFLMFIVQVAISTAQDNNCSSYLAVHEMMSVTGGVMTIDDEGGIRQVKATSYNIDTCSTSSKFPSGKQFVANYTLIGLSSPLSSGQCVTKSIGGKKVMESMQAVVIQTNGWLLEPVSIDLDDIDSEVSVPEKEAWMESAAAFGIASGEVVLPKMHLFPDTLLSLTQFLVPQPAMATMGLPLAEQMIPGAEFSGKELFNCPFGKENSESARCRINLKFETPVDTIVFLYGLKQQSLRHTDSAMFVSQIDMKCGCRCVSSSAGSRKVALPSNGVSGECRSIVMTTPMTECDILGKQWCSMNSSYAYKINGEQLPNGNFPCYAEAAVASRVLADFSPSQNFSPTV